jgi:2'-5' RNA ligase
MPYAICLKSCNATASEILKLWDEARIFEAKGSMQELGYPPHLTLAVFEQSPRDVGTIMAEVFSVQKELLITFDAIKCFDNETMVLWAKPRSNHVLSYIHGRLHGHFEPQSCHEHYRIGRWVPHCSLATRVPQSAKPAAIQWAESRRLKFTVKFDVADFVQFPPVVIQQELRLR